MILNMNLSSVVSDWLATQPLSDQKQCLKNHYQLRQILIWIFSNSHRTSVWVFERKLLYQMSSLGLHIGNIICDCKTYWHTVCFYPLYWWAPNTSWICIMQSISQEAAFAAIRPFMYEIVVESDLEVWMQQDNSVNPSVIHTIFTHNLRHSQYTWVWLKYKTKYSAHDPFWTICIFLVDI